VSEKRGVCNFGGNQKEQRKRNQKEQMVEKTWQNERNSS